MQKMMKLAMAVGLFGGLPAGCMGAEEPMPQGEGLTVVSSTDQAFVASYCAGEQCVELRAALEGDRAVSTISDQRGAVMRLELPAVLSPDVDLRGLIADAAAASSATAPDLAAPDVAALYTDAVDALNTAEVGSSLRAVLSYQAEVAVALRLGVDAYRRPDMVPDCGEPMADESLAWHTEAVHGASPDGVERTDDVYLLVCLEHDLACLGCDHWYCGWNCQVNYDCLGRCGGG